MFKYTQICSKMAVWVLMGFDGFWRCTVYVFIGYTGIHGPIVTKKVHFFCLAYFGRQKNPFPNHLTISISEVN